MSPLFFVCLFSVSCLLICCLFEISRSLVLGHLLIQFRLFSLNCEYGEVVITYEDIYLGFLSVVGCGWLLWWVYLFFGLLDWGESLELWDWWGGQKPTTLCSCFLDRLHLPEIVVYPNFARDTFFGLWTKNMANESGILNCYRTAAILMTKTKPILM